LRPCPVALFFSMISSKILTTTALTLSMAASLSAETPGDQLAAKQKEFVSKVPPEKAASYQAGIDAVAKSGILDRAKKTGDKAPDFTLKNAMGKEVSLLKLLEKGPVVLTWYRGGWCPHCNLTLAALQEKLPEFQAAGATLVALTPELPDFAAHTTKKGEIAFEVLSDLGNNVAREYGIVFIMTPDVAEAMRKNANTVERNGDESDELPLAAAFVQPAPCTSQGSIHNSPLLFFTRTSIPCLFSSSAPSASIPSKRRLRNTQTFSGAAQATLPSQPAFSPRCG